MVDRAKSLGLYEEAQRNAKTTFEGLFAGMRYPREPLLKSDSSRKVSKHE